MDISKQLENNEQRCRYGSACNVMRIMPGEQPLDGGQNIIGAIPVGAVIESFSVIAVGWGGDVIATIGTSSFPTTFFSGVTLVDSVSQANAQDAPVEMYFPEGEMIVSLPNEFHIVSRLKLLLGKSHLGDFEHSHIRLFCPKRNLKLFTKAGLKVERVKHISIVPPRWRLLAKFFQPLAQAWPSLWALSSIYRLRKL